MEQLSYYAPIAVFVALAGFILLPPLRYYRGEVASWWRPTLRNVPAAAAAGLAAAVAAWGADQLMGRTPVAVHINGIVAELRAAPMLGVLLDDVPGAEEELHEALRRDFAEARSPEEINRTVFDFSQRLVAEHTRHVLRAADDELIVELWEASRELVHRLAANGGVECWEPFATVLNQPEADETFLEVLSHYLTAMERAYRDGIGKAPPELIEPEAVAILAREHLGFTSREFELLADPLAGTAEDQCEIGLLMWTPLDTLPETLRVPYARYMLTSGGD